MKNQTVHILQLRTIKRSHDAIVWTNGMGLKGFSFVLCAILDSARFSIGAGSAWKDFKIQGRRSNERSSL